MELTKAYRRAIIESRLAMARTIAAAEDDPQISHQLLITAVAGAFADVVSASTARPEIVATINQQIGFAGFELIAKPRS